MDPEPCGRQSSHRGRSPGGLVGHPGRPGSEVTVSFVTSAPAHSRAVQPRVGERSCLPSALGVDSRDWLGVVSPSPYPCCPKPCAELCPVRCEKHPPSSSPARPQQSPVCPALAVPGLLDGGEGPVGGPDPRGRGAAPTGMGTVMPPSAPGRREAPPPWALGGLSAPAACCPLEGDSADSSSLTQDHAPPRWPISRAQST